MIYQTYKGARLDLEAYKGKATIDYEIEVDYDNQTTFTLYIGSNTSQMTGFRMFKG